MGEKAKIIALAIVEPLASLTTPEIVLLVAVMVKVWLVFGEPASVRVQALGQPVILSCIGLGITHKGATGGPIIIPSLGIAGPMPIVHTPFCLGRFKVAIVSAVKTPVPGVAVLTVNCPGPPAKISNFSVELNVLALAVKLTANETPPSVEVKLIFRLMILVEVALIGDGSPKPK